MTATIAPLPANDGPNPYVDIFSNYINCTLEDSLAKVKAVKTALPDEDRIQACHVLDYGLKQTDAWTMARELTQELSTYIERSGDWEVGNQTMLDAIEAAQKAGDVNGEITQRALYARLLQRQGRTKETIHQYRSVIRMARKKGNRFEEARACSNLGYLFIDEGKFLRSEVLCKHSLGLFETLESTHGLAHTHNHIGVLYTRLQRIECAESHLKHACELWQHLQDHHGLFNVYTNFGFLYTNSRQLDLALDYLERALRQAQLTGEQVEIAKTWNNIGLAYLQHGDCTLAEANFERALELFSEVNDQHELVRIWNNLGLVNLHCRNYEKAKKILTNAHMVLSELEQPITMANTCHNYGLSHQLLKEWDSAWPLLVSAQMIYKDHKYKYEELKVLVALTASENLRFAPDESLVYRERLDQLLTDHADDALYKFYLEYRQDYSTSLLSEGAQQASAIS